MRPGGRSAGFTEAGRAGLHVERAATVARVPRSPEPARREILDAALRIFATNRISAVSMREIRLAAKQRNGGALQYHFGDMDGLLRALHRARTAIVDGPAKGTPRHR